MPSGSIEKTKARKEEIINACEKLYKTMSFKEIRLQDIGNETSFSRTSIYNYFQTKEEIFLSLLKREYDRWICDLEKVIAENETMNDEDIAQNLAKTLERRTQLLKILSMNHYDLEENCRVEHLIEFKLSYGKALSTIENLLIKFKGQMSEKQRKDFIYTFFPFMFGIYPYTAVSEKQKEAMKKANVNYTYSSIYDLIFNAVKRILIGVKL